MDNLFERVYILVRQVPKGKVTTYGEIAHALGNKRLSRQVGWALHNNPKPIEIPCHRVVNRFGRLADAFKFGGVNIQRQLLEGEGVVIDANDCVDMDKYLFRF